MFLITLITYQGTGIKFRYSSLIEQQSFNNYIARD